ncbi:MAG: M23 family metallopeptidase [Armatimonadetes bacterium]|nr:M23 family metallopeptidase [Armatimonadota bacterium]
MAPAQGWAVVWEFMDRFSLARRWAFLLACLCLATLAFGARHKSLSRLQTGLEGVRKSSVAAQDRIDALDEREEGLMDKVEAAKSFVKVHESLVAVKKTVEKARSVRDLRKKLTSLYDHGHTKALALVFDGDVRQVLSDITSKQEVLDAIEKADDYSPKTIPLANAELKKIRYERDALQKKLDKCAVDERSILAEMKVVKGLGLGDIEFIRPVPGKVTSPFGERLHPLEHTDKPHEGVDLRGGIGDPVKVAASGKVIFTGVQRGYGNIIVVQHNDTYETAYGHLSEIDVEVGDIVEQGDVIGKVGATGRVTGPHLHFEIRVNSEPVDPLPYL